MLKLVTIRVLKIAEKGWFFKCPRGPGADREISKKGWFYAPQSAKFRKRGTFTESLEIIIVMCARKSRRKYLEIIK